MFAIRRPNVAKVYKQMDAVLQHLEQSRLIGPNATSTAAPSDGKATKANKPTDISGCLFCRTS